MDVFNFKIQNKTRDIRLVSFDLCFKQMRANQDWQINNIFILMYVDECHIHKHINRWRREQM